MTANAEDQRIDEARVDVADAREVCAAAREVVATRAAEWAVSWWRGQTVDLIRLRPETAIAVLGRNGLARLKHRLEQLCDRASALVGLHLGDGLPWPHLAEDDDLLRSVTTTPGAVRHQWTPTLSGRLTGPLDEAMRLLVGHLGPVVMEAGLDSWHVPGTPDDVGGGWSRSAGAVRWVYALDYGEDLLDAVQAYSDALGGLEVAGRCLHAANHAKLVEEAMRMWESVDGARPAPRTPRRAPRQRAGDSVPSGVTTD